MRDDEALLRSDLFNMATAHSFSVLASHSVKQPVNPKTGLAFTTYERKCKTETTGGSGRKDQRHADGNAPVRGSGARNSIRLGLYDNQLEEMDFYLKSNVRHVWVVA